MPSRSIASLSVSRVVPGISVTIARSRSTKQLKRLDLPTFGLPVIATAVNGSSEAIEHGVTGLLVPPRDADSLAQCVLDVLFDPELASRLGAAARQRSGEFELAIMIQQLDEVYAAVTRQPPECARA